MTSALRPSLSSFCLLPSLIHEVQLRQSPEEWLLANHRQSIGRYWCFQRILLHLPWWCIQMYSDDTCTLPETYRLPLKIDGWKINFVLGWPIFRDYVSFRKCVLIKDVRLWWSLLPDNLHTGLPSLLIRLSLHKGIMFWPFKAFSLVMFVWNKWKHHGWHKNNQEQTNTLHPTKVFSGVCAGFVRIGITYCSVVSTSKPGISNMDLDRFL